MTTLAARTPIANFQDILDAMAQNPELEAQMRYHLQNEDFRNLPQAVARLAAGLEELAGVVRAMAEREERRDADIAELKAGQDELKAGQARHDADIAELKEGQARHDADIAELKEGQARLEAGQARHDADIAELKEGQARLEAGQARHDADIAELKEGQARLEAGQARHDADIAELKAGQTRMQGGLNRLIGSDFERRIARQLRRRADRHFGIYEAHLLYGITIPNNNAFPDLLDDACAKGLISQDDADWAEAIDLVVQGKDSAGAPRYAAVEASVTVDRSDIDRAVSRSRIIARATAASVVPAVVGVNIPDPLRNYAASLQVAAIVTPD